MEHGEMARNLREASGALTSVATLLFDKIKLEDIVSAQMSPARGSPVVSSTSACPMTHPTAGYTCPSSSTPPCAGGPPPGAACQPLRQMPCGDVVDSHGHLVAVARTNVQLPGIQAAVDEMMKEFKRQMGDKIDEIDKLDNVEKCEEKEGNKKKRKFDHEGGAL